MNKTWILATMALTLAASCSRDRDVDNQDNNKIDDTTIEEIVLGAGQSVSVSPASRGIGAVGDLKDNNSWNGETVYVYGINTKATGDAQFAINGQAATAPASNASGSLEWAKWDELTETYVADNDTNYYYNGNDVYDFYGAHVDNAVVVPTQEPPVTLDDMMKIVNGTNLSTTGFAVNVILDGTQDLMVAKTDKAQDINDASNAEVTSPDDEAKLYSAWSARRNVTPNLKFDHLLTRLRFQAVCGNETAPNDGKEIYIDSIKIDKTLYKGSLQIIPSTNETPVEQGLTPVENDSIEFCVKQNPTAGDDKNLDKLDPVAVISVDNENPNVIGKDLLLIPAKYYDVTIYASQTLNGKKEFNVVKKRIKAGDVTPSAGGETKTEFAKNEIYYINIVVRGIEEITVKGSLNPWVEGGNAVIDDEDI